MEDLLSVDVLHLKWIIFNGIRFSRSNGSETGIPQQACCLCFRGRRLFHDDP